MPNTKIARTSTIRSVCVVIAGRANKQAVKAAKDYLSYDHFSRQGLIEQLEYEGYTPGQAQYGASGAGL